MIYDLRIHLYNSVEILTVLNISKISMALKTGNGQL